MDIERVTGLKGTTDVERKIVVIRYRLMEMYLLAATCTAFEEPGTSFLHLSEIVQVPITTNTVFVAIRIQHAL